MKDRIIKITGWLLAAGLLTIVASVFLQIAYMGPSELDESDPDVERIMAMFTEPGFAGSAALMESYTLSGSWAGDSEKAFALTVSEEAFELFLSSHFAPPSQQLPDEMDDALEFITDLISPDKLSWFPDYQQVLQGEYFVHPLAMRSISGYVDSARLLILHPATGRVYYGQLKM